MSANTSEAPDGFQKAVERVETMIATWERDGGETYCDLSIRIVVSLLGKSGMDIVSE
jgi:hypothetical protein